MLAYVVLGPEVGGGEGVMRHTDRVGERTEPNGTRLDRSGKSAG